MCAALDAATDSLLHNYYGTLLDIPVFNYAQISHTLNALDGWYQEVFNRSMTECNYVATILLNAARMNVPLNQQHQPVNIIQVFSALVVDSVTKKVDIMQNAWSLIDTVPSCVAHQEVWRNAQLYCSDMIPQRISVLGTTLQERDMWSLITVHESLYDGVSTMSHICIYEIYCHYLNLLSIGGLLTILIYLVAIQHR